MKKILALTMVLALFCSLALAEDPIVVERTTTIVESNDGTASWTTVEQNLDGSTTISGDLNSGAGEIGGSNVTVITEDSAGTSVYAYQVDQEGEITVTQDSYTPNVDMTEQYNTTDMSSQYVINAAEMANQYYVSGDEYLSEDYPYYPIPRPTPQKNTVKTSTAPVNYNGLTGVIGIVTTRGGVLNIRPYPDTNARSLEKLPNGSHVTVLGYTGEWIQVRSTRTTGYVPARYLKVTSIPVGGTQAQQAQPQATTVPQQAATTQTTVTVPDRPASEQYKTLKSITPVTVTVHPSRVSGFVSMRWAPSTSEEVVKYLTEGYKLQAIAANGEWVQVIDTATNQVGYVARPFVSGL